VVASRGGKEKKTCSTSFNPLHCGAVVASPLDAGAADAAPTRVSIPFIAGQWSLPARIGADLAEARVFQSPSLRAVVASSNSLRSCFSRARFNPLHCGAVVAS